MDPIRSGWQSAAVVSGVVSSPRRRAGAASLDMVLTMGVVLPMVGFVLWAAPRTMNLVYEMTCVLISWPFL